MTTVDSKTVELAESAAQIAAVHGISPDEAMELITSAMNAYESASTEPRWVWGELWLGMALGSTLLVLASVALPDYHETTWMFLSWGLFLLGAIGQLVWRWAIQGWRVK